MIDEIAEKLKSFGLTSYEAKAFVTLIRLGEASAREISDCAGIPRTKIYDVLKRLAEKGFIEVQPGNPTFFKAFEPLDVAEKLQQETLSKIKEFLALVKNIQIEKRRNVQHIWVSRGEFAAQSKVKELLSWAKKELLIFVVDPEFTFEIPKPEIAKVLLYEKVAVPASSIRVIDKSKLKDSDDFFLKYAKVLDGYDFNGVRVKPCLVVIADSKKSILVFREGHELVAVTIAIPLIVLFQRIIFESLWNSFTL